MLLFFRKKKTSKAVPLESKMTNKDLKTGMMWDLYYWHEFNIVI